MQIEKYDKSKKEYEAKVLSADDVSKSELAETIQGIKPEQLS